MDLFQNPGQGQGTKQLVKYKPEAANIRHQTPEGEGDNVLHENKMMRDFKTRFLKYKVMCFFNSHLVLHGPGVLGTRCVWAMALKTRHT